MRKPRFPKLSTEDFYVSNVRKSEESGRYRLPMSRSSWENAVKAIGIELLRLDQKKVQMFMHHITWGIEWLDPIMTRYCRETCPSCEDPCCTGQKVFFNQADLLYLTALSSHIPPGQTRSSHAQPCRYLGEKGCHLSRFHRPYVCVWYLCDAQMQLLSREPNGFQKYFIMTIQNIRKHRLALESLYELHSSGR